MASWLYFIWTCPFPWMSVSFWQTKRVAFIYNPVIITLKLFVFSFSNLAQFNSKGLCLAKERNLSKQFVYFSDLMLLSTRGLSFPKFKINVASWHTQVLSLVSLIVVLVLPSLCYVWNLFDLKGSQLCVWDFFYVK